MHLKGASYQTKSSLCVVFWFLVGGELIVSYLVCFRLLLFFFNSMVESALLFRREINNGIQDSHAFDPPKPLSRPHCRRLQGILVGTEYLNKELGRRSELQPRSKLSRYLSSVPRVHCITSASYRYMLWNPKQWKVEGSLWPPAFKVLRTKTVFTS